MSVVALGSSVSDNRGGLAATDAGLWQFNPDGSIQSITLLEAIEPDQTSVALGLNDAGNVVGRIITADRQNVTVYWGAGETSPELLPVLTEDSGSYVRAGQIVGYGVVDDQQRAFLLTAPTSSVTSSP